LRGIKTRGLKGNALRSANRHISTTKGAIDKYSRDQTKTESDIQKFLGNLKQSQTDLTGDMSTRDMSWIDYLRVQGERNNLYPEAQAQAKQIQSSLAASQATNFGTTGTAADVAGSITGGVDTGTAGADNAAKAAEAAAARQAQLEQLNSVLTTISTQAQQSLLVSQAQYSALQGSQNLLPFGGSFATGGIVPGPSGQPMMVVAHGGEAIGQPAATAGVNVRVIMEDNRTRVFVNDVEQMVEAATRRAATGASRSLPGSRYGWGA
jgi:hypothetical protein